MAAAVIAVVENKFHLTSSSSGTFYSLLGFASLHNFSKLIKSPLTWALNGSVKHAEIDLIYGV